MNLLYRREYKGNGDRTVAELIYDNGIKRYIVAHHPKFNDTPDEEYTVEVLPNTSIFDYYSQLSSTEPLGNRGRLASLLLRYSEFNLGLPRDDMQDCFIKHATPLDIFNIVKYFVNNPREVRLYPLINGYIQNMSLLAYLEPVVRNQTKRTTPWLPFVEAIKGTTKPEYKEMNNAV